MGHVRAILAAAVFGSAAYAAMRGLILLFDWLELV